MTLIRRALVRNVAGQRRQVHAVYRDGARTGFLQQREAPAERCLAGAGRADDAHHLATIDVQCDVVESCYWRIVPAGGRIHLGEVRYVNHG